MNGDDNMVVKTHRSGRFVKQTEGYSTFIPNPLPPEPPIDFDEELLGVLSEATLTLGRLDGIAEILPNPDLFVMMYVKKEAVLSSQIEGTQASLIDVLEFEARALDPEESVDVSEVVNYVKAMSYGLKHIQERDFSISMIREMHRRLLTDTRGSDREPGELRTVQNWIGPPDAPITEATFIPPDPIEMMKAIKEFEGYLQTEDTISPLVRAGLIHAQFESIHPFLDGNGRIGRLLITLQLVKSGHLSRPLLYLSYYLKQNRAEYYDRLQAVRTQGAWEEWMQFFLKGVHQASVDAIDTSRKIINLRTDLVETIADRFGNKSGAALGLLEELFNKPYVKVNSIEQITGLSYPGANRLATRFEELEILNEVTGQKRNRIFEFYTYLDILNEGS